MAQVHPNYIKASNLILISTGIGIINILLSNISNDHLVIGMQILVALFVLVIMGTIAYFMRRGSKGVKYVLLVLLILGLPLSIPSLLVLFKNEHVTALLSVVQSTLQIWSVILLFQVPKNMREYDEYDYVRPGPDSYEHPETDK